MGRALPRVNPSAAPVQSGWAGRSAVIDGTVAGVSPPLTPDKTRTDGMGCGREQRITRQDTREARDQDDRGGDETRPRNRPR